MSKAYFMGIDTGTNSSKGIIMDETGNVLAVHTTSHSMHSPRPGYYEHDADKDWWGDFCTISKALLQKTGLPASSISALGLSALGADCLPVDKDCNPLRPAILYGIDARATAEMEELTNLYGEDQIKQWYGRELCSSDVMPKILWIKHNEPEIYEKTHKFLTGSSFLTAKLTGEYVIDRFLGLASFNPLYNPVTHQPDEKLCAPICRPDQLARIKEAAEIAGYITEKAAAETGLAVGTPVITGTDDSGAEAISSGVVSPGKMMLQLGSSVYMILGTKTLVDDPLLWREEFIVPGLCDISAGTNTAGSLTKWCRDAFYEEAIAVEQAGGKDAYEIMMDSLGDIPPGSNGLLTLPYFAGERTPVNDPKAKGLLIGLTLSHTKEHIYKSILESVGFSICQQIRIMESHPEVQLDSIYAVGGGAKNEIWLQIIADITGKDLLIPEQTIGAAFGDALMAALAIQHPGFEDYEKLTNHIQIKKVIHPNPAHHELYASYQKLYDELYPATKVLMHQLDAITTFI